MYYPYFKLFIRKICCFLCVSFLFIVFFLTVLPDTSFANVKFGKPAEEYRALAYDAQQEGEFDRALTFYSKAVALGGNDAWIYNNVGVIYEQLGASDKAEAEYLKALELDPVYLPAYTNLAFLYKERGDIPRAVAYFRARIERAPANDEWVEMLVKELNDIDPTYRKNLVDESLQETRQRLYQIAQEELSLNAARADGLYRLAKELEQQNQFDEALAHIDKALILTPTNSKLTALRDQIIKNQRIFTAKERVGKAMEFLDSGDMDSARQEFQTILTILPGESVQK